MRYTESDWLTRPHILSEVAGALIGEACIRFVATLPDLYDAVVVVEARTPRGRSSRPLPHRTGLPSIDTFVSIRDLFVSRRRTGPRFGGRAEVAP